MVPLNILTILVVVFMISILWTNLRGAPWLPTPMSKVYKMLAMADVGPNDMVYDLGCGDGRTIIAAARRYGARAVGIEIDPLRYLWCQLLITILRLRGRVQIIFGDIFAQDLGDADVVTCYLLPKTNKKLEEKFGQELRPSTRVISNYFNFPGLQLLREDEEAGIYLYHPVPNHTKTKKGSSL
ncbi:MAG: SAM-dependent methyltransferase [Chloroflexi bacterium]|jgi:SAM-dependent methyltransferase|nr:SAM-dependent methyltransferase [Chloroflexota bacterium]